MGRSELGGMGLGWGWKGQDGLERAGWNPTGAEWSRCFPAHPALVSAAYREYGTSRTEKGWNSSEAGRVGLEGWDGTGPDRVGLDRLGQGQTHPAGWDLLGAE